MSVVYRLKFEDVNLEPIEDYDVSDSKTLNTFTNAAAYPTPELDSVYLTQGGTTSTSPSRGHPFVDTTDVWLRSASRIVRLPVITDDLLVSLATYAALPALSVCFVVSL